MRNIHVIVSETVAAVLNFIGISVLLNVYSIAKSLRNQAHVNACIVYAGFRCMKSKLTYAVLG